MSQPNESTENPIAFARAAEQLCEMGRYEEAIEGYRRAIRLKPDLCEAYINLGATLSYLDRYEESLVCAQKAIELQPERATTHYNLGDVLRELGHIEESIPHYLRALKMLPERSAYRWSAASTMMLAGRLDEGWNILIEELHSPGDERDEYPYPSWRGESLAGKTLVVHSDQGIGDEIFLASALQEVIDQAARVIFVCEPRLAEIFRRSFPQIRIIGYRRRKDRQPPEITEQVDYHIPDIAMFRYLRPTLESIPAPQAYLQAAPERVAYWRERLRQLGPGIKIGISWRGGGRPMERRKRTVPLRQWQELLSVEGAHFVNLQYGDCRAEIAEAAKVGSVIHDFDEIDPLVDMDEVCALTSALDLVISVANATVLTSGSLGVPTWTFVSKVPYWRWQVAGDESLWFENMKIVRQEKRGEWAAAFRQETAMLCERTGTRPRQTTIDSSEPQRQQPTAMTAREADRSAFNLMENGKEEEAFQIAEKYSKAGDFQRAKALCLGILERKSLYPQAWNLYGLACEKLGDIDEAVRALRLAVNIHPIPHEYHFNLGVVLQNAKRYDEAITAYQEALQRKSDDVAALVNIGTVFVQIKRPQEAIACYDQAIQHGPQIPEGYMARGLALASLGQVDAAIRDLQSAVAIAPDRPQAQKLLERFLRQRQEALQPSSSPATTANVHVPVPKLAPPAHLSSNASNQANDSPGV